MCDFELKPSDTATRTDNIECTTFLKGKWPCMNAVMKGENYYNGINGLQCIPGTGAQYLENSCTVTQSKSLGPFHINCSLYRVHHLYRALEHDCSKLAVR